MDPKMMEMLKNMLSGQPQRNQFPKKNFYNKSFVLNNHEEALASHDAKSETNQFQIQNTTTPALHTSANVKLDVANQITLATLVKSIDKVCNGKFLLCRTIAPPFKMTALATVVDDPAGNFAVRLSLYNYVSDIGLLPVAKSIEILPVGTILVIKNPWFKTTMDGGLSLRCDNPGDVVIMDEAAVQSLNPNLKWVGEIPSMYTKYMRKTSSNDCDYKRRGNEYFVGKRYLDAIKAYTDGLKLDPTNTDLLANRAAAYLNIGNYKLALSDAEDVLLLNPTHLKAIFRKTRALWGLKLFFFTKEYLETQIVPILPNEKEIKDLLLKTNMLISQSQGQYEIKDVLRNDPKIINLDWADYEGAITIKQTTDGRGRGMFATKDIPAGQLILASKAFGFVLKNQKKDLLLSSNLETKLVSDASQTQLVASLAHSLRDNPDKGKVLYKLFAGPKLGYLDSTKGDDCSLVDMKRIDAICSFNSFGHGSAFDIQNSRLCGLWVTASYINHSCIDCNGFWTIYGDFLFVRAFKDIKADEEIIISYMNPAETYVERQKLCQKFGFSCTCSLCEYDKNEPKAVTKERDDMLKKIESLETESFDEGGKCFTSRAIPTLLPLLERLLQIRPRFSLILIPTLEKMAAYYFKTGEYLRAFELLEMNYKTLKDTPMCTHALQNCMNLIAALLKAKQKKKAKLWVGTLRAIALNSFGTLDVLDAYPMTMNELTINGLHIYNNN